MARTRRTRQRKRDDTMVVLVPVRVKVNRKKVRKHE